MRKLLYFLCFLSAVFCDEGVPYEQVIFGGAPEGIVAGCVGAITGSYFISEMDWVVQGAEPIPIQRRYLSENAKKHFSGWEFFYRHLVARRFLIDEKNEMECSGGDHEQVTTQLYGVEIPEKEGFSLSYKGKYYSYGPYTDGYKLYGEYPQALTNCYGREVGSRHCAFRNSVRHDPNTDKIIYVDGGDGWRRTYFRFNKHDDYRLTEERLPNGNKVWYEWKQIHYQYRLTGVKTTDGSGKKVYAWIRIHYEMDGEKYLKEIRIRTSDNQYFWYKVKNVKGNTETYWVLSAVESTCIPNEKFEYWGNKETRYYVNGRHFPEGRGLKIDYYVEGKNWMPRGTVNVRKKHKKKMRVKQLNYPAGQNGSFATLYSFYHHPGKYKSKKGSTIVVDPYGASREFFYNKDFLLTKINYLDGDGAPFSSEVMEWKEYNSEKGHWLRSKTLRNNKRQTLRKIVYHYDKEGNVYLEELVGNHTGCGNTNETFEVRRKFNKNSLVKEESDSIGKKTVFEYVPGTSLISKKLTFDRGCLKIREFFFYDGAVLTKTILDDGQGNQAGDLSGVTERMIVEYAPKTSGEFLGFPEVVTAKYWDKEGACEQLLYKRKIEKYSPQGMPEQVTHFDADNQERYTLNYTYDAAGKLISESDPMGRTRRLKYDSNNNLIYEKAPDDVYEKITSYDFMNHPVQMSQGGRSFQLAYDLLGRKVRDTHFRKTVTEHRYDAFGHPTLDISPSVVDETGTPKSSKVKRIYNALGKVEQEIDPLGNNTSTYYTCRGKPCHIVYPDGSEERYCYNLRGEVTKHIAPNKTATEEQRDCLGRVVRRRILDLDQNILSEELFEYNSFHCTKHVASDGVETHYFYDGAGRKIREETLDRVITYQYDALGREEKRIESGVRSVVKKYDLLDRVLEEREEDDQGNLFAFTAYTFDDFSNKIATIKEVQVGESIHRIFYDPFKREVKQVDPLGYETSIEYDDFYVNELGQNVLKKTTTNPKGVKTVEIYGPLDRLVMLQKWCSQNKLLLTEKFIYDLKGNKKEQRSFFDGKEIVKTWKYDVRGRVVELNESGEKITTFTYTPDGKVETMTKPDGTVISYAYNGLGRRTEVKTSDGSCHYTFKHDKMGHVIESRDELTGQVTYRSYNHFGDLLSETLANGLSISRTYDAMGRPKELIFSDHSKVVYDYDPYHLKGVKRLDSEGALFYEHTYDEYDKSHNLLSEFYPGSIGPAYHQVDLLGRRIRTDSIYSSEVIAAIDATGNVTQYLRDHNDQQEVMEYTYDDLDQLTSESGMFSHQYTCDAHYNRIEKDEEVCEVDSLHQLLAQGETTYTHDPNGNRITTLKGPHEIHYTYDGLDRLTHICSGSKAVRFSYDSWGRCLSRTYYDLQEGEWNPTKTDHFLFDGQNELGAYPHELRILGQGKGAEIGAAIVIERGNDFFVPIHDLYGNVIASMYWDGTCLESYRHSAYGEEKIFNGDITLVGSTTNPWRYQSKRKTAGLINFGRRFYDPETGRWLSPDPKGFDEGPNLYQYLRNSPYVHIDLYGAELEKDEFPLEAAIRLIEAWKTYERDYGYLEAKNYEYHPDTGLQELRTDRTEKSKYQVGTTFGIKVDYNRLEECMKTFSDYAGGRRVEATHSPTVGFFKDIAKANLSFNYIATESVFKIVDRWKNHFDNNSQDARYLEVPHSRGGAEADLALLLAGQDIRDRVVVVTIASAKFISSGHCREAYNYTTKYDFVPKFQTYLSRLRAQNPNVVTLPSLRKNRLKDHSFDSKVYSKVIPEHISKLYEGEYD